MVLQAAPALFSRQYHNWSSPDRCPIMHLTLTPASKHK